MEDDEFALDLLINRIEVNRPTGITTGKNGTFIDIHNNIRRRDRKRCLTQGKQRIRRIKNGGVGKTDYEIKSTEDRTVNGTVITILNIALNCNKTRTPWCDC